MLKKNETHACGGFFSFFFLILYEKVDSRSIKNIKLKYNKALKLNYQLILKKNNIQCDEFFHFYIRVIKT